MFHDQYGATLVKAARSECVITKFECPNEFLCLTGLDGDAMDVACVNVIHDK